MSTIQLDVSEVQKLKNRISQLAYEVDECYREVNKISMQIDMKVRRRKDIDADLLQIKNDLKKQKEFLDQCQKLIGESINEFVEAEKIDHVPDVRFTLKSTSNHSSYSANNAFSNLLMGTSFVTLASIMSFFIRPRRMPSVVDIVNLPSIAEWIDTKWPQLKNAGNIVASAATIDEREHGGGGRGFDDSVTPASVVEPILNGESTTENTDSTSPLNGKYSFGDATYNTLDLKGIEGFDCDQHTYQEKTGDSGMCTATAWAIATNINRANSGNSKMVDPCDNWGSGGRQYLTPFGLSESGSSATRKLEVAYEELQNGHATWIRCTSKTGASGHDVVVVGLTEGCDPSNLKTSDFLIIDPADGTTKSLASYKVKDGSASVCRYTE